MSGICLDALNPAGCPSMDALHASGTDGARIVAFDDPRFFSYGQEVLDAGFKLAVVLARESFPTEDYAGWASFYAERIAPTYWIIGNEMDAYLLPEPSPSSWKMTPQEYADFWYLTANVIRTLQPEAKTVIGGLVAGQPSYLEEVLPLLEPRPWGVDIHPYGRPAGSAADLFDLYRGATLEVIRQRLQAYAPVLAGHGLDQRRLMVLEWNRAAEEIASFEAMLRSETGWATWFCWSDGMVPGFGLVGADGAPTDEFFAFEEANTMTAIDERAAQLTPEVIGEPLGPEVEVSAGVKMRPYYNGVLVEIPNAGVYALAEATVASKFRPSSG